MSLYRKYRPKTFAEVVGQDHIVTTLENAVEQKKLAHAYLFSGPRGTGKTSIARILAKMLLTKDLNDEKLERQVIKAVEEESIVDLLEIDAASYTQVDNIRELIEKIQFSPVVASAKVYIIDEVHMLSKSAFNALLKTLEEPPDYAYFILATTELNKVPATIQSRCQRFPFRSVREEDIIRHLQFIADQEKITIDRAALRAVAHHAQGGMRDAISLLDQLRSLEKITVEHVKQSLGETGQEYVETMLVAIEQNDRKTLLEIVQKMEDAGVALDLFLRQLLSHIRVALHAHIEANEPIGALTAMLETILNAIKDIRIAPVPGLVLESALLSLCAPGAEDIVEPVKKKKTEVQPSSRSTGLRPAGMKDPIQEEIKVTVSEATVTAAVVEAPELSLESLRAAWPKILNEVSPASVKMSLKNGRILGLKEKTVTVSFASAFHRDKVATTDASRKIEEIMEKIFRSQLKVECIVEDEKNGASDDTMVNLAQAATEIF